MCYYRQPSTPHHGSSFLGKVRWVNYFTGSSCTQVQVWKIITPIVQTRAVIIEPLTPQALPQKLDEEKHNLRHPCRNRSAKICRLSQKLWPVDCAGSGSLFPADKYNERGTNLFRISPLPISNLLVYHTVCLHRLSLDKLAGKAEAK